VGGKKCARIKTKEKRLWKVEIKEKLHKNKFSTSTLSGKKLVEIYFHLFKINFTIITIEGSDNRTNIKSLN
jgi:hypothetical protein